MTKPEGIHSFHYAGVDIFIGPDNMIVLMFVPMLDGFVYTLFAPTSRPISPGTLDNRDDREGPAPMARLNPDYVFYGQAVKEAYRLVGWADYEHHKDLP